MPKTPLLRLPVHLLGLTLLVEGCGSDEPTEDLVLDTGVDAVDEVAADTTVDADDDAAPDTGEDATEDASTEDASTEDASTEDASTEDASTEDAAEDTDPGDGGEDAADSTDADVSDFVDPTTFANPPELELVDGVYELTMEPAELTFDGARHCLRTFNGLVPAPTIRIAASDSSRQVRVDYENTFSAADMQDIGGGTFYDFNQTNLHGHGLHVQPDRTTERPTTSFTATTS